VVLGEGQYSATYDVAAASLAEVLVEVQNEPDDSDKLTFDIRNLPGNQGCDARELPDLAEGKDAPFGNDPLFRAIVGSTFAMMHSECSARVQVFFLRLGVFNWTDRRLCFLFKRLNGWAFQRAEAVLGPLSMWVGYWGCIFGHTLPKDEKWLLDECQVWLGDPLPRNMDAEQYGLVCSWWRLGIPTLDAHLANADWKSEGMVDYHDIPFHPSVFATPASSGGDAAVAGTRATRVSAYLSEPWEIARAMSQQMRDGDWEGTLMIKAEEEGNRSILMTKDKYMPLEGYVFQGGESLLRRSIPTTLGRVPISSWQGWIDEHEHMLPVASNDTQNWDDVPPAEESADTLLCLCNRLKTQHPPHQQGMYGRAARTACTRFWKNGFAGTKRNPRRVRVRRGNASGVNFCTVLNTSGVFCIEYGWQMHRGTLSPYSRVGIGDDLRRAFFILAQMLLFLADWFAAGLSHPRKGGGSCTRSELVKLVLTPRGRTGWPLRARGATLFAAPWAGGIPGPHSHAGNWSLCASRLFDSAKTRDKWLASFVAAFGFTPSQAAAMEATPASAGGLGMQLPRPRGWCVIEYVQEVVGGDDPNVRRRRVDDVSLLPPEGLDQLRDGIAWIRASAPWADIASELGIADEELCLDLLNALEVKASRPAGMTMKAKWIDVPTFVWPLVKWQAAPRAPEWAYEPIFCRALARVAVRQGRFDVLRRLLRQPVGFDLDQRLKLPRPVFWAWLFSQLPAVSVRRWGCAPDVCAELARTTAETWGVWPVGGKVTLKRLEHRVIQLEIEANTCGTLERLSHIRG
jgi:hypothetical protein